MSFLAPLFLLGTAALALPVVFHLIRRSSRDRVPFSSLMFLLPTPPRVTRRSKLENIFLLLLRCLVIALLAFAFARPFFSKPITSDPIGRAGQKLLILVDVSASMKRGSLWTDAKARARDLLQKVDAADQVACYTFDHGLHTLVSFDQWNQTPATDRPALVLRRLEEASPGWGSTRLGNALISSCETFESSSKDEQFRKRIALITDLQEGSRLDGLQGFEWPRGLTVTVEALPPRRTSNAGLQLIADAPSASTPGTESVTRVRIYNSGDAKRDQLQVGWRSPDGSGAAGATVDVYIPPGQNRVISLPAPEGKTPTDRLVLTGDDESFDNTVYVGPLLSDKAQILFLGNDRDPKSSQLLFYLNRAFQQTRALTVEVRSLPSDSRLEPPELAGISLLIVHRQLPIAQVSAIRAWMETGHAVLVPVTQAELAAPMAQLAGREALEAEEFQGASYSMLSQIDFQSALFSLFADPRYSDFTKIHFWKHRRLPLGQLPNCRILASFDNGDPALAEITVGRGRIWVLTSGWHPDDSQLALSTKFVPLLYGMLEQCGAIREPRLAYTVGDLVPLPGRTESVTVIKPDASQFQAVNNGNTLEADQPGIYTVTSSGSPVRYAVNLAPEESRTAPLPLEELERIGVPLEQPVQPVSREVQKHQEYLQAAQLENRQKLWRWLIVGALVVLVLETWLAGRVTGRAAPVPGS